MFGLLSLDVRLVGLAVRFAQPPRRHIGGVQSGEERAAEGREQE